MTEQEVPLTEGRSSPQYVVMENSNAEYGQAFLYSKPGWVNLAQESTAGLWPSKPGRSLIVTEEGRFVITKGYLVDIEQSLATGSTILQPMPHWARMECVIPIDQEVTLAQTQLPVVREVFVDRMTHALATTPAQLRLPNPFEGEVEQVISAIGTNPAKRDQHAINTVNVGEDYL